MKNKKGFTLVEVLSTLAIMTVVATVGAINMIKIMDEKEKANDESINNVITSAACVYIELDKNKSLKETCLTNGCNINTDILISAGLLKKEDVDKREVIHIYKENNEKVCTIQGGN